MHTFHANFYISSSPLGFVLHVLARFVLHSLFGVNLSDSCFSG